MNLWLFNKKDDSHKASVAVDSDVEISKSESQGAGRTGKVVAKSRKGDANVKVINNVYNFVHLPEIPDKNKEPEEYAKLVRETQEQFKKREIQFVDDEASQDVRGLGEVASLENNSSISYLAEIVPEDDLMCMITGLYVRHLNDAGNTEAAKRIRDRAAQRSQRVRNIINLTSAGFLEEYVVPILKADAENATTRYSEIVEEMPEMVFVSSSTTVPRAMELIEKKIRNKEKYEWKIEFISVNGLNQCIEKIEEIREEVNKKYPEYATSFQQSDNGKGLRRGELRIELSKI